MQLKTRRFLFSVNTCFCLFFVNSITLWKCIFMTLSAVALTLLFNTFYISLRLWREINCLQTLASLLPHVVSFVIHVTPNSCTFARVPAQATPHNILLMLQTSNTHLTRPPPGPVLCKLSGSAALPPLLLLRGAAVDHLDATLFNRETHKPSVD